MRSAVTDDRGISGGVRSLLGAMAMGTDKGWLLPPARFPDDSPKEWMDSIGRLCLKAAVQVQLQDLLEMTKNKEMTAVILRTMLSLNTYYDVNERVIARHEAKGIWEHFRLLHRQLAGAASEFSALASRRPEQTCNAFKAQQVNRILLQLKELMREDIGLVSEEGGQSYSDVCLLLRGWLDLCADYAWRHYDGNPPEVPEFDSTYNERLLQEKILSFCQDEPKGILEIGEMLCYRDKKTIRKYLKPLLAAGRLAYTIPDKPTSRNQKYITARMI